MSTKSWILRHPLQVPAPPHGYRQVEVVRAAPDFNSAIHEAQRYSFVQQESINRRRASHYSVRDYYTVLELDENSTAQDALDAFFERTEIRRTQLS